MSRETAASQPLFSPSTPGRSTPSPSFARNIETGTLAKQDKGFRRYAAEVERTLALWDAAQHEWADYISFLHRLDKALQSYSPETPIIPHSDTVALRLSQCLNPTLPAGVHQKALEVYDYIFAKIGHDALARDLGLYFPGLAPVMSFASLKVRPMFLALLEQHILRLGPAALRPALKSLILSLLPGVEDETSEDFERVIAVLDSLRNAVSDRSDELSDARSESGSSIFWQCFFLATITNAPRRQGALAYLSRRLSKFGLSRRSALSLSDQSDTLPTAAEAAITPEPGLLIRCFQYGLSDAQLLTQRGFLDMLVTHLPLDSPVLQSRIDEADLTRLVGAAAGVVARRDMSLNRRLWTWLLGPDPEPTNSTEGAESAGTDASAHHAAYFSRFGLRALTACLMEMINSSSLLPADRARPFRVCLSLMDRGEVGGYIVPEVFLPALQSIFAYSEVARKDQVDEVIRSASNFFDGVESGLIWGKLIHLVTSSLDNHSGDTDSSVRSMRSLRLAKFVLSNFNLKEEEMLLNHMPLMILSVLAKLNQQLVEKSSSCDSDRGAVELAFEIAETLIQTVPERALRPRINNETGMDIAQASNEAVLQKIRSFYEDNQGNLEFTEAPFAGAGLGQMILRESTRLFTSSLDSESSINSSDMPSRILSALILKVQHLEALDEFDFTLLFQKAFPLPRQGSGPPFQHLVAMTVVLSALQTANPNNPYLDPSAFPEIVQSLVLSFWEHLSPAMPKYHVEAVRCILQLHTVSSTCRFVEAAISGVLVGVGHDEPSSVSSAKAEHGRRFPVLWSHVMHELSLQTEKRGSVSRRSSALGLPTLATFNGAYEYESILMRPLLLFLENLAEDATAISSVVRGWLKAVPTLSKVFGLLIAGLQTLSCLETHTGALSPELHPQARPARKRTDDTRHCLYYLRHILRVIENASQFTWDTLIREPAPVQADSPVQNSSMQQWLVQTCISTLALGSGQERPNQNVNTELSQTAVKIILHIYKGPYAATLRDLELEVPLIDYLRISEPSLQSLLLEATLSALKLRLLPRLKDEREDQKSPYQQARRSKSSQLLERASGEEETETILPPARLVDCIKHGFSSPSSRLVLGDWVQFLSEVLPLFSDTIFQNLLPLVDCICKQVRDLFELLKDTFSPSPTPESAPESTLIALLNGLEQILAKAHERLRFEERKAVMNKSPEQPQGLFANMVSGVFTSESTQARSPTANSRLTVMLCFQDSVRICFAIWSWGAYSPKAEKHDPHSAASFGYTSLRMRNRARRILENLFEAEALECLETLVDLWKNCPRGSVQSTAITSLLNVLNGARPKYTIPAIFNAVYSRSNPNAEESSNLSAKTSDLADIDLAAFLVDYMRTLEDDAMDEIWRDCSAFLGDVLTNPLPHRQILPALLDFVATIGLKMDNTNFGEQKRTRKELAQIFTRILTAIFTTRSSGAIQDTPQTNGTEEVPTITNGSYAQHRANNVVSVLGSIAPHLQIIFDDSDRVSNAVSSISNNIIGPSFRTKVFPENVTQQLLDLVRHLMRVSQGNKYLKKEVGDIFNDPRFLNSSLPLLMTGWAPVISLWAQADKTILPELLAKLSAPTTAGIMFGVGATSARLEADRKTQLTLRRIILLVLATPTDTFTPSLSQMISKIVELLAATPASSPSSATRSEVIVLIRALILKTSPAQLSPLWPIINAELASGLESLLPDAPNKETYNNQAIIQTCKLLDQLVILDPDDFQLSEWHFFCDTIDAVYKPSTSITSVPSLADEVAEVLSMTASSIGHTHSVSHSRGLSTYSTSSAAHGRSGGLETSVGDGTIMRYSFLEPLVEALEKEEGAEVVRMARKELLERVVRPFLGGLAIAKFEAEYVGGEVDVGKVWEGVVRDAKGVGSDG